MPFVQYEPPEEPTNEIKWNHFVHALSQLGCDNKQLHELCANLEGAATTLETTFQNVIGQTFKAKEGKYHPAYEKFQELERVITSLTTLIKEANKKHFIANCEDINRRHLGIHFPLTDWEQRKHTEAQVAADRNPYVAKEERY